MLEKLNSLPILSDRDRKILGRYGSLFERLPVCDSPRQVGYYRRKIAAILSLPSDLGAWLIGENLRLLHVLGRFCWDPRRADHPMNQDDYQLITEFNKFLLKHGRDPIDLGNIPNLVKSGI